MSRGTEFQHEGLSWKIVGVEKTRFPKGRLLFLWRLEEGHVERKAKVFIPIKSGMDKQRRAR